MALRSRIVLVCAAGHSIMEVSRRLGIAPDTVRTWRHLDGVRKQASRLIEQSLQEWGRVGQGAAPAW
ncbi:helix-turn-helix domain-containing protein [Streptomyces sp. NPDC015125]|uniref:helix-turn-helix domain-containing protein n=1 Tax=Streptomyces sp. NPDC015125 TaxID=3364938 RepID=UPI0036FD1006